MQILLTTTYTQALRAKGLIPMRTDGDVRKMVMDVIADLAPQATNKPAGPRIEPTKPDSPNPGAKKVLSVIQKTYAAQAAGSISIVLCGETHRTTEDTERAELLIDAMEQHTLAPTLTIFERGMGDNYPVDRVPGAYNGINELAITSPANDPKLWQGLSGTQRNLIVAGYIFLCIAGGDQNAIDRVLIFFGENHGPLLNEFEYFAQHTAIDWINKRPRTLLLVRSSAK